MSDITDKHLSADEARKIMGERMIAPADLQLTKWASDLIPRVSLGEYQAWESHVPFLADTLRGVASSRWLVAVPVSSVASWFPLVRDDFVLDQRNDPWFLLEPHQFGIVPNAPGWVLLPHTPDSEGVPESLFAHLVLAIALRRLGRDAEWRGGRTAVTVTDRKGVQRRLVLLLSQEGVRITTRV